MRRKVLGGIIALAGILALCTTFTTGCGGGPVLLSDSFSIILTINAPPEKVFSTVHDNAVSSKWLWVTVTKAEGEGLGAITEWTYESEGEKAAYQTVIVDYVPNQRTVERFTAIQEGLYGGGTIYVLYIPVEGGTKLIYTISYLGDLPGMTAPLRNTLRNKIRSDIEAGLKKLKAVAEG